MVATGKRHTHAVARGALEAARTVMGEELERFAENTLEYLREEDHLLTDSPDIPELTTDLPRAATCSSWCAAIDYREDLASLRPYLKEVRPSSSVSTVAPTPCSSSG